MNSKQKTSLGFLISILIFAVLTAFAYMVGFKFIEINFYEPTVIKGINSQLEDISENFSKYFDDLNGRFSSFVGSAEAKTFIERESEEQILFERENKLGSLREQVIGIEGIRFIEDDGIHIHYSTFKSDILVENDLLISYKNYPEYEIPFSELDVGIAKDIPRTGEELAQSVKLYFDEDENNILFCYPFYDRMDAYRGTFIFYVSAEDFIRSLAAEDVVNLNTKISVLSPKGLVFSLPNLGRDFLKMQIKSKWDKKLFSVEQLTSSDTDKDMNLFLISCDKNPRVLIGWVCEGKQFVLSEGEKVLLLICLLFTVFLTILLLFNLRHDDMVIIKNRIKKFQYALLKEYVDRKDSSNWQSLAKEISERKFDVFDELKNSLGKRGKKHDKEVDELLDAAWLETLAALGGKVTVTTPEENKPKEENTEPDSLEPVEDLEEVPLAEEAELIEEVEPLEELDEVEELDAADTEPLEEVEPVEEEELLEEVPLAKDAAPREEDTLPGEEPAAPLEEVPDAKDAQSAQNKNNDSATDEDRIEYVEETLEEFQKNDKPVWERTVEAEEIKRKTEENFNVETLDFSHLDE